MKSKKFRESTTSGIKLSAYFSEGVNSLPDLILKVKLGKTFNF